MAKETENGNENGNGKNENGWKSIGFTYGKRVAIQRNNFNGEPEIVITEKKQRKVYVKNEKDESVEVPGRFDQYKQYTNIPKDQCEELFKILEQAFKELPSLENV